MTKALKEYVKFPQSVATNRLHTRRFKRKGYRFLGWNTKKDGTGYWYPDASPIYTDSDNDKTEVNEPLNLYAQWDNTVDSNEGTAYKYTPYPFYNAYGGYEDLSQLPLVNTYNKQLYIEMQCVINTKAHLLSDSINYYYGNSILTLVGQDESNGFYGVQVVTYDESPDINIGFIINGEYNSIVEPVNIGDKYTLTCRMDKKRLVFTYENKTKDRRVAKCILANFSSIIQFCIQGTEGAIAGRKKPYMSNYKYYSAQFNSIQLYVDSKKVIMYKPVTLLQDYTFNNGTFTNGTSGFVDTVNNNFYVNYLVDPYGFQKDGYITIYKAANEVNVTLENGNNISYTTGDVARYDNGSISDDKTKFTVTLNDANPYCLVKMDACTNSSDTYAHFTFSDKVKIYGKISALNGGSTTVENEFQYYRLFADQPILTAPEIDTTNTTKWCLAETFAGCKYLKESPTITVDKVVNSALSGAFMDCTSLRKAGKITVSTGEIEEYSMNSIFAGDTSLTEMTDLTSITKAGYKALDSAFSDCECLKKKDLLPSGELADHWNDYMFDNTGIKEPVEEAEEIDGEELDMEDTNAEKIILWNDSIATSN